MARVLITEDEPTISFILSEVLREEGHEVISMGGGAAAIEWLEGNPPPDIVLLDLFMPGVGGRAVVEAMRRNPTLTEVPVILVTGAVPSAEDFPAEGAYQGLIIKPFGLREVVEAVENCLKRA